MAMHHYLIQILIDLGGFEDDLKILEEMLYTLYNEQWTFLYKTLGWGMFTYMMH